MVQVLRRQTESKGTDSNPFPAFSLTADRKTAKKAFDLALSKYEMRYSKAMECLAKDREDLLTFYDFPAEHWVHVRMSNVIESVFLTSRLRTARTRNCGSRDTTLEMVFKLTQSAEKRWRRLRGYEHFEKLLEGALFRDGVLAPTLPDAAD